MEPAPLPSDLVAIRELRRARPGLRPLGEPPTIAVVGARPDDDLLAALTASGWRVSGLLLADVFDGILWAARSEGVSRNYVELPELLLDPDLDAACIAVDDLGGAASTLHAALRAGLHVLLPAPAGLGSDVVRRAIETADDAGAEHAVAFPTRWNAAAATVTALLARGDVGAPHQVTVRRWPSGATATADLVDAVAAWCGEVVAVCADPGQLPASTLPGGGTVRWALLTESGATVLVAHDGADVPTVRLTCPQGRLEVTPTGVAWAGGAAVPCEPPPTWFADGRALAVGEPPPGAAPGLLATAHRLALAAYDGDGGYLGADLEPPPGAATLRDLFVTARVREALHLSAADGRWVETG